MTLMVISFYRFNDTKTIALFKKVNEGRDGVKGWIKTKERDIFFNHI
jgi:hypothetical protein